MRVFITGASGFIGRSLANQLRANGYDVTGVDLVESPGVVAGDLSRPGPWQDLLSGSDLVLHTAALVSNRPTLARAWQVNTVGTRNVLDACVRGGVQRFVYVSSVRAFSDLGFPDGVTEDHPVRPDGNPYVDTRIATEQVVLQAHAAGEIPVTIVRPGDVYGPGSRPWTLLPLELIRRGRFVLPAGGTGIFSPVYIADLVAGISLAATRDSAAGHVFTLSGGVGVTNNEFFGHYYRMLGKSGPATVPTAVALAVTSAISRAAKAVHAETEIHPTAIRYFLRTGTYSIEKARRMLSYEPKVGLAEGMQRTEDWLREQGLLITK